MNIFNENNLLEPTSLDSSQSCQTLPASACDESDIQERILATVADVTLTVTCLQSTTTR